MEWSASKMIRKKYRMKQTKQKKTWSEEDEKRSEKNDDRMNATNDDSFQYKIWMKKRERMMRDNQSDAWRWKKLVVVASTVFL